MQLLVETVAGHAHSVQETRNPGLRFVESGRSFASPLHYSRNIFPSSIVLSILLIPILPVHHLRSSSTRTCASALVFFKGLSIIHPICGDCIPFMWWGSLSMRVPGPGNLYLEFSRWSWLFFFSFFFFFFFWTCRDVSLSSLDSFRCATPNEAMHPTQETPF
ncbi:hypothetical protein QBC45DRAFT_181794 [Copromyces sp. CBS 386.78]|nr:hypothetical protein QBC45DRAFT_181794 [Copromyces sp. CBS 386.78]